MFGRGLPVPEEIGKCGAASRNPGTHGARRDAQHLTDVGVIHPDEVSERDRGAVLGRQVRERSLDVEPVRDPGFGCRPVGSGGFGEMFDGTGRRPRRRDSSSAAFVATRYAQVENFERPSNDPILRAIASNASWVASSASSGLPRIRRQTP